MLNSLGSRLLALRLAALLLLPIGAAEAQPDGTMRWAGPFRTMSTAAAGNIVGSPAVAPDGTLYIGVQVGSASSASTAGILFALNPNGTEKWRFETPDWIDSTPAIAPDGTIYFGCWDGKLYALRPDGTAKWTYPVDAYIASSPAIGGDGTIYIGGGTTLAAINPDGSLRWTFPAPDWIDSSPAIGPDGTLYFGCWDFSVYAVRPDGTEKWRYATESEVVGSPALAADGTVYIGSRDVNLYSLNPDGTLKWRTELDGGIESSPVLGRDGTVYVTTDEGRLHALAPSGAERWRFPTTGQTALNPIYSSPAVRADGSIVFGSSDNAVFAVRPDGSLLWQSALGDWTDSSPLVTSDGSIYIGCSDKSVYALASASSAMLTDWPQLRRDPQRTGWQPMGTVPGTSGRLTNMSIRTLVATQLEERPIIGFVVGGTGGQTLLVRAVGPTLGDFGLTGWLPDPQLAVHSTQGLLDQNDNWGLAANAAQIAAVSATVGAFPLPEGSADAAVLREFAAGPYTVPVSDAGGATGVALMELYSAGAGSGARLVNVSARSVVAGGESTLIAGFVIEGQSRAILVRGIGPTLAEFGVPGTMGNPELRVYRGQQLLAENNDWSIDPLSADAITQGNLVGAFPLEAGSADAVLLLNLPAGIYTAQVTGVGGETGIALVEVYETP